MGWTARLTQPSLLRRAAWAYLIYAVLLLAAFAVGYFLLPRGVLRGTPWTAAGAAAATPSSPGAQLLLTVGFNLMFALLGVAMNLQRVRGFPAGYLLVFAAGIGSGLVAGTNSFVQQVISPYTLEGWLVALRVQHVEMLGYTLIVASTIRVGLNEYSSWLPGKAKEQPIQHWRDIRLSHRELAGVAAGIALILFGAYNETVLAL